MNPSVQRARKEELWMKSRGETPLESICLEEQMILLEELSTTGEVDPGLLRNLLANGYQIGRVNDSQEE